jgi:glutathione S-transferase
VRIVLAEKGLEYETVVVDLDDRPAWIYEKNPLGRVPALEEDTFVLAESAVIDEYLEDRYPEPALWPADPADRALGRMLVFRFDELSRPYYALRRGDEGAAERFDGALAELDGLLESQAFLSGREFGLADVAYVPWILRARDRMEVELTPFPALADWVTRLEQRSSIAAELEVVGSL